MAITLNRDKFGQEERQKLAALMAALRPFVRSSKQAAHLYKTGKHLAEDLAWIFNKAAPLNGGSRFFSYQTTPHDANRCAENTSMKTPANLDL